MKKSKNVKNYEKVNEALAVLGLKRRGVYVYSTEEGSLPIVQLPLEATIKDLPKVYYEAGKLQNKKEVLGVLGIDLDVLATKDDVRYDSMGLGDF